MSTSSQLYGWSIPSNRDDEGITATLVISAPRQASPYPGKSGHASGRGLTVSRRASVRTSCTGSRRPRGAARAADSAGAAALPLRSRPAGLYARSAGAKGKDRGRRNPGKSRAAADLTGDPSRRLHRAHAGGLEGGPIAGKRTAAAPCQIRRSVKSGPGPPPPRSHLKERVATVNNLLTGTIHCWPSHEIRNLALETYAPGESASRK